MAGTARGARLRFAMPGWGWVFFNFPFIEEKADNPGQICRWRRPSHMMRAMPAAASAPGLDCHPKCEPAPGKAAKVRILLVQPGEAKGQGG